MKISAIDIGSNAIRQIIVDVDINGNWTVLKKHRECIRLGADVFSHGQVLPETVKKLVPAFKKMAKLNKKYKTNKSVAIATSAFRDAKNQASIIKHIFKNSGIRIKVISGQIEAELIRLAVAKNQDLSEKNFLLIDIGGGSVELTHIKDKKNLYSKSFKWGAVRLNSIAQNKKVKVQKIIDQLLKEHSKQLPKASFTYAVGTGGNIDSMAKLKMAYLKKAPNTFVTYQELNDIYKDFIKTKPHLRCEKFKLKPDRADVIEPAMHLTLRLMKKYDIKVLKIPGVGLKEGAILALL